MASPWYITDLVDIDDAENAGTWSEMDVWTGGGTVYTDETDYYIHGDQCTSQICTKTAAQTPTSLAVDYGSDLSGSFTSGETVVLMWHVFLPANAVDTYDNGGMRFIVGASVAAFSAWKVGGNDFGRYPYGGWQNTAVDPSFPADYTVGGGHGGAYQWFGSSPWQLAAISKGAPHGVDAIRYGRAQLQVVGGEVADPATFVEMAFYNDEKWNRWGLFQEQSGSYLWKGLMTLGDAASACYFDDANRNINIDITNRTYRNFNRVEIRHASSTINWDGINFVSLRFDDYNLSKGQIVVVDNATFYAVNCTFTDMDYFYFLSNTEMNTNVFRRSGTIYQQGSLLDGCTITNSTSAIAVSSDNIENIKNCDFISRGTGHAIELIASGDGDLILDGNTFSGYASANGSTGNEAIWNNSGGWITLNVQNSTSIPSIRNGIGSQTTVQLSVTLTLSGVVSGSEIRIQTARGDQPSGAELYHLENSPSGGIVNWTYNYSDFGAGYYIDIIIHNIYYTYYRLDDILLPASNTTIPIQQLADRWYANP